MSRLSPPHGLVDMAKEIAEADALIAQGAEGKLRVIAEQIRQLQAQAQKIAHAAHRDASLHRAECRFQRSPGHIYHLYERAPGEQYMAQLSPADWGGQPPHPHVGSFRLRADGSWQEIDDQGEPIDERAIDYEAVFRSLPKA